MLLSGPTTPPTSVSISGDISRTCDLGPYLVPELPGVSRSADGKGRKRRQWLSSESAPEPRDVLSGSWDGSGRSVTHWAGDLWSLPEGESRRKSADLPEQTRARVSEAVRSVVKAGGRVNRSAPWMGSDLLVWTLFSDLPHGHLLVPFYGQ